MTALVPVAQWGWNRYRVDYYRDEEHFNSGEAPLLSREFVESDSGADAWVFGYEGEQPEGGWPFSHSGQPGYANYEVVQTGVEATLRFSSGGRMGGTIVHGSGWVSAAPPGWHGRGPTTW